MIYMKSASASDGILQIDVTFKVGTDIDLAQVDVQNRVAQALPRLPEAVRQVGVSTVKASPTLTMVVFLSSPDGRYDALYLRNVLGLKRAPEFEAWLERMRLIDEAGMLLPHGHGNRLLAAAAELGAP